jgi:hypothetical protein
VALEIPLSSVFSWLLVVLLETGTLTSECVLLVAGPPDTLVVVDAATPAPAPAAAVAAVAVSRLLGSLDVVVDTLIVAC